MKHLHGLPKSRFLHRKTCKTMNTKPTRTNQQSLFFDMESKLNQKYALYLLANKIDWDVFEAMYT